METVKSTMKRLLAKRRKVRVRPDSILGAFEGGIRLVDKAQIPFGGPVFALAGEIITMLQVASDNNATAAGLIRTIESYTEKLEDFAMATRLQSRPPDDPAARQIKKAAQNFASITESVKEDLEAQGGGSRLVKFLASKAIRDRLAKCSQDLQQAHHAFHTDQITILAWDHLAASRTPNDEYRILGARPLNYQEFEVLDRFKVSKHRSSFWTDTVRAEVEGQVKVVKMFNEKYGGRDAFEKTLLKLGRHPSPLLPSIYGYITSSTPPVIAFKLSSITPLLDHLWLLHERDPNGALLAAWNMMIDLRDALEFIHENEFPMVYEGILDTLRGAVVAENGKVILAPVTGDETDFSDFGHFSYACMVSMYWSNALRDVAARPFRTLGYAMVTDSDGLLASRPDFPDTQALLREMWPEPKNRCLLWPENTESVPDILPGDFGVFDIKPGRVARFRKLGNLRSELGGVNVYFSDYHKHHHHNVYSWTLRPQEHGAGESRWAFPSKLHVWNGKLQRPDDAFDFFYREAPKLAESFQLLPEDLVLVTEIIWVASTRQLISRSDGCPSPVEVWIHLDENGLLQRCYWSQDGERPEGDHAALDGVVNLPDQPWELKPSAQPNVYVQFEACDFR